MSTHLKEHKKQNEAHYTFKLFVIKNGENSERAKINLERICEKWLKGRYNIEVVDVIEEFQTALEYNILLTPSIVITEPKPAITIHGDLSNPQKLISILNLDGENKDAK